MRRTLKIHPASRCQAVSRIEVEVARDAGGHLALRYVATGTIAGLRLPPVTAPVRTDELWQHTCFEAFIRPVPGEAYREFNFAPSTQWAAYRFTGQRTGMQPAEMATPRIDLRSGEGRLELDVSLALGGDPAFPAGVPWRVGLSAVIEESGGRKSYWALTHPPGLPDFHHPDCFALELPAA